jgi:hypothetical protein
MGAYLLIEQKLYHAEDTGGLVVHNDVDVYTPSYNEAVNCGRRVLSIAILGNAPQKIAPRKTARRKNPGAGKPVFSLVNFFVLVVAILVGVAARKMVKA